MSNYFNRLSLTSKLEQLGKCRLMSSSEFNDGINILAGKKIVIVTELGRYFIIYILRIIYKKYVFLIFISNEKIQYTRIL